YQLRDKFPVVYNRIAGKIETDWEETEKLLAEAMDKGLIKKVPIPVIKLTIEGAIEKFLSTKELAKTHVTYEESLNSMIDIIINGLRV
ncbi:MAG: hypothetical protein J5959_01245, partial [Butyrivibrio sp.]|nr:hypothetical protein [Butyrivibrio sp.]